jgi:hypothetical protein
MKQLIDYQVKNNKELMNRIVLQIDPQRSILTFAPLIYQLGIAFAVQDIVSQSLGKVIGKIKDDSDCTISLSGKTKRMGAK